MVKKMVYTNSNPYNSLYTATIYGNWISNKIIKNVKSVDYNGIHIFCINNDNYTKMVVIDIDKKWLCGKYLKYETNILCRQSIINAYLEAKDLVSKDNYNIKEIVENTSYNFNLVSFYSEGYPNDNGLSLSENKDILISNAINHFNKISIYTPKILRELNLGAYVKEHTNSGLVTNKGMSKIGFCAWKPKIILLELEKMNYGDILIYRDCNIIKYPVLANYDNIKNIAEYILDTINFDFFVPREYTLPEQLHLKQYTKTNVIRELGEDHPFNYDFPMLFCGLFTIIKKSTISINLLKEWEMGCLNDNWINGEKYGDLYTGFRWSCPEQSILCQIIANWIRKNKYNIPKKFPLIGFKDRDIYKIFFYNDDSHYSYLNKL
tara:strand:+ start:200 stop:1333 length:1134 start_codon:yes stop_codon:yes gene_type:complete